MNYNNIYNNLINRAILANRKRFKKVHILYVYYEKHHIIPKCIGGTDDKTNLVLLTAEEHYLAHQLLVKIHPAEYGLVKAAIMMAMNCNGNRPKNKLYGWLRRRHSETTSGENNINFGKPRTDAVKLKISGSNKGKGGHKLKGQKKKPISDEQKLKISVALKGRPAPHQVGDNNVMKRPEVVAKALATRKGKPRKQKRDSYIFKFENIITGEIFEGTRRDFRQHSGLSSGDISGIVIMQKITARNWKLFDVAPIDRRPDSNIYIFKKIKAGIEFTGSRCEFCKYSGISSFAACNIVKRSIKVRGWVSDGLAV